MLLHIPNVLTADEVAQVRKQLDTADWTDGRETVGAQGAQVKHNEQLPDASPVKAELGAGVLAALRRSPLFFAAALIVLGKHLVAVEEREEPYPPEEHLEDQAELVKIVNL